MVINNQCYIVNSQVYYVFENDFFASILTCLKKYFIRETNDDESINK